MSAIQQMMVNDRVKSMAAMASGISHHVRNSMTAMTCYFEELDAAQGAPRDEYIDELRDLAKKERDQLARIVQSVTQHIAQPQVRISDEADLGELVRQAAKDAEPVPVIDRRLPQRGDVEGGPRAAVECSESCSSTSAGHAVADGPVRVWVETPVAHWNTTGVRVHDPRHGRGMERRRRCVILHALCRNHSDAIGHGPDLLDSFQIALAHGGDLLTHKDGPLGPGFELRMPLDPASVRRPVVNESCLAGARP